MKKTHLLNIVGYLLFIINIPQIAQVAPKCYFVTDKGSEQVVSGLCSPIVLDMESRYTFSTNVDSNLVRVLFVWNDGTGAVDTITPVYIGANKFLAHGTHIYPPSDECSYTAQSFIIANGEVCTSSSLQEQTIISYNTDNLNSGNLFIDPPVDEICEGDTVVSVFSDQSEFNCRRAVEPDNPNIFYRWVQFIYNTDPASPTLIPNASVIDDYGNIYPLTDAAGNTLNTQYGPVVPVPDPAEGPNQTSWTIIAPAGGINGDFIEITMRNWNECNKYDSLPYDGIDPVDTIMGDNPPIETRAYVRIITTPASPVVPTLNTCVNQNITLNSGGGNILRWYDDIVKTTLLSTGNNYDPTQPPLNIDNTIAGSYTVYITDAIGLCESNPNPVNFNIFNNPTTSIAGTDQYLCTDNTTLSANTPLIGTGEWSTSGGASITDPGNPVTTVTNLSVGENIFTWTITNGPCISSDDVRIYRDLQPAPANAGTDTSVCNISSIQLYADAPTNGGVGKWTVLQGGAFFDDSTFFNANLSNLSQGVNTMVWTVSSTNGGCATTYDTTNIIRDIAPDPANAGTDQAFCETSSASLSANTVNQNGTGTWSLISGSVLFNDINNPSTNINSIDYNSNILVWTIESELGICENSTDTVLITRYEMPAAADAGSDQLHCNNIISNPLSGNITLIGSANWQIIGSPFGSSPSFNPDNTANNAIVQIPLGDEGIYTFTWNIDNGLCHTEDTIIIDFGIILPPTNAGNDTAVCDLSINLNADTPPAGKGTWRVISGNGIPVFSDINDPNTLISINPGNEGRYLLEWSTHSGSCIPLPEHTDTVEIYFRPKPAEPVYLSRARCGDGIMQLTLNKPFNATTYNWYDDITGSNLLTSDTVFTTPVLSSNTRYYYSAYNDTSLCESNLVPVDFIINPIPDMPISSDVQNCGADTVNLSALVGANGLNNRWFNNDTDIIPIAKGNYYKTPVLSDSRSYWVTSYHDSTTCESNKLEVKVTIDSIPQNSIISDTGRCGAGSFTLEAKHGLYATINRWYDQAVMGTLLATSESYITNYLDSTKSYWVSSYNEITHCESERVEMKAIINPIPDPPVVSDTSICGSDTIILSAVPGSNGTTVRWYDMPGGTNVIGTGINFQTPYLTSTTNYWLSTYNDITYCESARNIVEVEIKNIPLTTPIQGYNFVRLDQENVVYSVDYHTNSTYIWDIPATVTKITEVDNFVILGFPEIGSQFISVTEIAENGCTGNPQIKEIVVTNEIISITIDPQDVESCHGDNVFINVIPKGGNAPYFFNWSGDTTYLTNKGIANPVFKAIDQGIFKLNIHVWDIDDNHAFDTMTITVNGKPKVNFIQDMEYVCSGKDYQVVPQISGGSGIYSFYMWSGNTVGLSSLTIPNPTFNSNVKNEYEMILTVLDSKSCIGKDTIKIINVSPEASFTTDALPSCSPETFNFINNSVDATHYLWDFNDGNSSSDTSVSHEFINLTNMVKYYEVVLTAFDEHNCTSANKEYVTLYPNPDHSFTVLPGSGCDPVQSIMTSIPGGFAYNWDFGDGNSESGNYSVVHVFRNEGNDPVIYGINLKATSFFNCTDTFTNTVTVYPSPKANFEAVPETQRYPDATIVFTNISDGNYDYFWDFGDETTINTKDPGSYTYINSGNYEISLKMIGKYCSDSTSQRVNILPAFPVAKFKSIEPGCEPHTVQFENQSLYADSYFWDFGDNAYSYEESPRHTYFEPGTYKIILKARNEKFGLENIVSDFGRVDTMPIADFIAKPNRAYVNYDPVQFTNGANSWHIFEWDFGDGTKSNAYQPKHYYQNPGYYDVTLKVWTHAGCYDEVTKLNVVIVENYKQPKFPNVIRPNSKIDENTVFKPGIIPDLAEDGYHLMIFNRWGELIFESNIVDIGWDGTFKGQPVKSDVYIWKLEGRYADGKPFEMTGDVTILY